MTTSKNPTVITVEATVNVPIEKAWKYWAEPKHIMNWCNASDDWHAPKAENDLRTGGKFSTRMEAKDGSFGFDFGGVYSLVKDHEKIEYAMEDGRKVQITFVSTPEGVKITEHFDAEDQNPVEMQKDGWQAILDNYKKYTESH